MYSSDEISEYESATQIHTHFLYYEKRIKDLQEKIKK